MQNAIQTKTFSSIGIECLTLLPCFHLHETSDPSNCKYYAVKHNRCSALSYLNHSIFISIQITSIVKVKIHLFAISVGLLVNNFCGNSIQNKCCLLQSPKCMQIIVISLCLVGIYRCCSLSIKALCVGGVWLTNEEQSQMGKIS